MKRLSKVFTLALAGFIAAGVVACDSNDPINEPGDGLIEVSPDKLEFSSAEGSKTVTVTGNNWDVTETLDWVTVEEAEGKFTVTVTANATEQPRTGDITVANGEDSKTVTITQAVDETLTIDPARLDFDRLGETKTVAVTSNLEWTATEDEDWIEIVKGEGTFDIVVARGTTTEPRTGTIVVSNGVVAQDKTVTVDQAGLNETLSIDLPSLEFPAQMESKTVLVTSEPAWEVISSEGDWFNYIESDTGLTVTSTVNNTEEVRTGSVTVSNGVTAQNKTITLSQEAGQSNVGDGDIFTSANATYWGLTNAGTGEYELNLEGEYEGEACTLTIALFTEPVDGSIEITEGEYVADMTSYPTPAFTFSWASLSLDGGGVYDLVSGSFSVSHSGEDYVIDLDVVLNNYVDDLILDTTYTGAIAITDNSN